MSELSEQDKADLKSIGIDPGEEPTQRSLLEVWRELLGNAEEVGRQDIPIHVAHKVVASWPFLTFQETQRYHVLYHDVLGEALDRLKEIIHEHPEALDFVGEDDAAHNYQLYIDALVSFHNLLDGYEVSWKATDEESHIWLAVLGDVRATIFSSTGMAGHLDAIGFSIENEDFAEAVKKSREVEGE